MKEETCLKQYQTLSYVPGIVIFRDRQGRSEIINEKGCRMLGIRDPSSLWSNPLPDHLLPCPLSELHREFFEEDQLALKTEREQQFLGQYCYNGNDWRTIFYSKAPRYTEGKLVGLTTIIHDIGNTPLAPVSLRLLHMTNPGKKQFGYLLRDDYHELNLSKRQSEVLFFLIRGKTSKEIAEFLDVSQRTVETHVEYIKFKLSLETKADIIAFCVDNGYANMIPRSIFKFF